MMATKNDNSVGSKKPDNIVWIEQVLLNSLEETGISGVTTEEASSVSQFADVSEVSAATESFSKSQLSSHLSGTVGGLSTKEVPSGHTMKSSRASTYLPNDLKIGIAEIELKDEHYLGDERIHTMCRIVSGKIKYFIENVKELEDEERYQHWILKLPSLIAPNRHLSQKIDAARREITFYTEILPSMRSFVESCNVSQHFDFKVPYCYYGKYLRPHDAEPDLDIITHILDSESLLVLDDLRSVGFGKKFFAAGLLISEAASALEEIVKFHVASWAMEQTNKDMSHPYWKYLYNFEDLAQLYLAMMENQKSNLQRFLFNSKHPKSHELYHRLHNLWPTLLNKLYALWEPATYPAPNCLLHMDLWTDNLLFRMSEDDRENKVPQEEADLDCVIIDWQIATFGKPTHDIALLIMLSMEPSYRREHTNVLLQYYYLLFEKHASYFGLDMPMDFITLKKEYKQSCVLATFMAIASIELVQMEEATQTRLMEALVDLLEDNLI